MCKGTTQIREFTALHYGTELIGAQQRRPHASPEQVCELRCPAAFGRTDGASAAKAAVHASTNAPNPRMYCAQPNLAAATGVAAAAVSLAACCPKRMIICASGRSEAPGEPAAGMSAACSTEIATMYGPCTAPKAKNDAETAQALSLPAAGSRRSTAAITSPFATTTAFGPTKFVKKPPGICVQT